MWRMTMLLLCLIAAVSGAPLRQAEAASDFARSIGEVDTGVIEIPDGGIGDDSDAAITAGNSSFWHTTVVVSYVPPGHLSPTPLAPWFTSSQFQPLPRRFPATRHRCLALLQCFLC